jgi:hypothetical protein
VWPSSSEGKYLRRIDGIAKQGLTGTRARPLELLNQLTSIVVETIEV